jgi:hypothetical protein
MRQKHVEFGDRDSHRRKLRESLPPPRPFSVADELMSSALQVQDEPGPARFLNSETDLFPGGIWPRC